MSMAQKIAQMLIDIKAIKFSFDPPFTYTSGMKSPIYLDNRQIISYPRIRNDIIEYYLQVIDEKIGRKNIDCISATATAAIPMGAWIADKLAVPMVYVRMKSKAHGMQNQIEGSLHTKSNVLVLEDHISTAKSLAANVEAIREAGGQVKYAMATTSYENPDAIEKLDHLNIETIRLAKGKEITEYAHHQKYLSTEQKESVDRWFEHPTSWMKSIST